MTKLSFVRWAGQVVDHMLVDHDHTACGRIVPASAVRSNRGHAICPKCEGAHPGRAELVERVLDYMLTTPVFQPDPVSAVIRKGRQVTAWDFDGAEPFVSADLTHGGSETINNDAEPWEVRWPIDVRLLLPVGDDDAPGHYWQLQRYRGLRPQETRGRVRIALPWPLEWLMADPVSGRTWAVWFGRNGPFSWSFIHGRNEAYAGVESRQYTSEDNEIATDRALVGIGVARQRRTQWRVYLGEADRPGIELPTTPYGASEAFRLRDAPPGKARRLALRHWVSQHWRTSSRDPDEEIKVRQHLQGATDFVWSGLRCRIKPSETDTERDAELKAERQVERGAGLDRRRKRR
jgi:hypothetical protein